MLIYFLATTSTLSFESLIKLVFMIFLTILNQTTRRRLIQMSEHLSHRCDIIHGKLKHTMLSVFAVRPIVLIDSTQSHRQSDGAPCEKNKVETPKNGPWKVYTERGKRQPLQCSTLSVECGPSTAQRDCLFMPGIRGKCFETQRWIMSVSQPRQINHVHWVLFHASTLSSLDLNISHMKYASFPG